MCGSRPQREPMKRREFITFLGGAATTWPLAASAQQPAIPVIGFLNSASPDDLAVSVAAFRQGVRETGYIEGQNVTIDYRWGDNQNDRLAAMAADLVHRQVAVITATNNATAFAAKAATTTIPIVFGVSVDPVTAGLVASLAQPGGNLTGITTLNTELLMKRLELLHEVVPTATSIALLVNSTNPSAETDTRKAQDAARILGLKLHVLHATRESDFDQVFAILARH